MHGIFSGGPALIQGNTISGTLYQNGGAGPNDSYCEQTGTGLYVGGSGAVGTYTHAEVIGNTITNNTQALNAGGIEVQSSDYTLIQGNIISNNSSSYVGGIDVAVGNAVSIIDNLIYANSAGVGNGPGHAGGLQLTGPLSTLAGNTFFGNTLASGASGESASQVNLDTAVPQLILTNNIVVGSSSSFPALNCGVNLGGSNPSLAFDHNDIYNPSGPTYGGACPSQTGLLGNISTDPLFVAPGSDFHLTLSSPAIDSGNNSEPGIPTTDLSGNPRIQDATHKGFPVVDMGAYEYAGLLDGTPFSTRLMSSLNPAPYGQSVTFSVTVTDTSQGATTPTGNIIFTDGTTVLSTQPLQPIGPATATAQFTTSTLAAGSHTITATYTTAANTPAGSASLTQVVTGITTTAILSSSVNPAPYGQAITLTASVSAPAGSGAPVGTIQFMDGASVLATQQLTPSGASTSTAAFTSSTLAAGTHTLSAVYQGSGAFAPASATLTENIIGISSTTTALTGSPNPDYLGTPITFHATVTSTLPGAGSPTGVITFTLGGTTVLGNQTLTPPVPIRARPLSR